MHAAFLAVVEIFLGFGHGALCVIPSWSRREVYGANSNLVIHASSFGKACLPRSPIKIGAVFTRGTLMNKHLKI